MRDKEGERLLNFWLGIIVVMYPKLWGKFVMYSQNHKTLPSKPYLRLVCSVHLLVKFNV